MLQCSMCTDMYFGHKTEQQEYLFLLFMSFNLLSIHFNDCSFNNNMSKCMMGHRGVAQNSEPCTQASSMGPSMHPWLFILVSYVLISHEGPVYSNFASVPTPSPRTNIYTTANVFLKET